MHLWGQAVCCRVNILRGHDCVSDGWWCETSRHYSTLAIFPNKLRSNSTSPLRAFCGCPQVVLLWKPAPQKPHAHLPAHMVSYLCCMSNKKVQFSPQLDKSWPRKVFKMINLAVSQITVQSKWASWDDWSWHLSRATTISLQNPSCLRSSSYAPRRSLLQFFKKKAVIKKKKFKRKTSRIDSTFICDLSK